MSSISEKDYEEQVALKTVNVFFNTFNLSKTLKSAGIYRVRGVAVTVIIKYLVSLVYLGKTMHQDFLSKHPVASGFKKDSVYRLINRSNINWDKFLITTASKVAKFFNSLTEENRMSALIVDDTVFERPHSKNMELSSRIHDHASTGKRFKVGFRTLMLGFTDGCSFVPILFRHIASSDKKNRYCEMNTNVDKRTSGGRIRKEALMKATDILLLMLKSAKQYAIPAKHVLFDCWFAHAKTIIEIDKLGFKVACRVKKSSKVNYIHEDEKKNVKQIFKSSKKRPGRSKYLLSTQILIYNKDGEKRNARLVFIRDRSNRKNWIALLCTDMELSEEEIIALYGKRWDIEVFFKVCKSYLKFTGEFQQLSYDAVTAHTAIVMIRYMMLVYEKRKADDPRSLGEIFLLCFDEMSDLKLENAMLIIAAVLTNVLKHPFLSLTGEQIDFIMSEFMFGIPAHLRRCLIPDSTSR